MFAEPVRKGQCEVVGIVECGFEGVGHTWKSVRRAALRGENVFALRSVFVCRAQGVPSQENTEREEFDMRDGKRRNPTLLQSGQGFERGSRGSGSSARCDAVVTIDTKTDPTDIPEPDLGPGEFLIDVHKDEDGAGLEIESISGMLLVAMLCMFRTTPGSPVYGTAYMNNQTQGQGFGVLHRASVASQRQSINK